VQAERAAVAVTEAAWREFHGRLRSFVARRVASAEDAEDIVQQVFLNLHRGRDSLRGRETVGAWLYRAARNAIVDYYRKPARRREVATGDTRESDARNVLHPGLDRSGDLACATECLTPLVQALPEPYRRAIERVELEGASQGDAARGEGLSLSGMKSRVQRARQRLSELLQERCRIALDGRGGIASCDEPGDAGGAGGCC
jgi:RNA polymerase sigma-70 factor (ECF subfamily)